MSIEVTLSRFKCKSQVYNIANPDFFCFSATGSFFGEQADESIYHLSGKGAADQ